LLPSIIAILAAIVVLLIRWHLFEQSRADDGE
jgi:hypothetical protein